MTARLGKALREGSRAEPAHEGVEYAPLSETTFFCTEKLCRMHPQGCFWAPGPIFDMVFGPGVIF